MWKVLSGGDYIGKQEEKGCFYVKGDKYTKNDNYNKKMPKRKGFWSNDKLYNLKHKLSKLGYLTGKTDLTCPKGYFMIISTSCTVLMTLPWRYNKNHKH